MGGKGSGYGARNPNQLYTGRFRTGIRYPEREATYFTKGGKNPGPVTNHKAEREAKMARDSKLREEAKNIQDIAREFSERAMKVLVEIMENENETGAARMQAAEKVIDRGYGKAAITNINANIDANAKPSEMNADDIDSRIAEALNRVERLTQREAKETEGQERPTDLRQYN
jgi:hypothetical protein